MNSDKDCCKGAGFGRVFLAFLTGAGVATTAILIANQAKKTISPSADQLLRRCSRAAETLDRQIPQTGVCT